LITVALEDPITLNCRRIQEQEIKQKRFKIARNKERSLSELCK